MSLVSLPFRGQWEASFCLGDVGERCSFGPGAEICCGFMLRKAILKSGLSRKACLFHLPEVTQTCSPRTWNAEAGGLLQKA